MVIAVIPARGGSKRIPLKNIRPLGGLPIIRYPIETARMSGLFDKIVVSTDSEKISQVALEAGAEVPFLRPKELADDFTPTADVLVHALTWFEYRGIRVEFACCIYPTAAFLRADDLHEGYRLLKKEKVDTVLSVTTFDFPVYRALRLGNDGRTEMVWPQYELTRSNDLPDLYHDAGQFYWLDAASFMSRRRILSSKTRGIFLPRRRAVDIDTEEDWEVAEQLWSSLKHK